MKHLILLSVITIGLFSCRKDASDKVLQSEYLKTVKAAMKDSLSGADFESLDFTKTLITRLDSERVFLLRIALKDKKINEKFVLLKTTEEGKVTKGSIISMTKSQQLDNKTQKNTEFNGSLSISGLKGNIIVESKIVKGYVVAFHPSSFQREYQTAFIVPHDNSWLPEVVVVGYYPSNDGGLSFSDYISLQSLISVDAGNGTVSGNSGYYNSFDPSHNNGVGGGGNGPHNDPSILIDYEGEDINPAIDIEKYIKCYATIPDAGAKCSVEIMADIPVDSDPNKLFELTTGSPGHTFLQIKKSNNGQSITQNIGFYPETGYKSIITTAPVSGKFVDNTGHEFNASYKINLTPEQLTSMLTEIRYLSKFVKYDIDEYNCTDFALQVFNYNLGSQTLEIPLYDIPGGMALRGTSTPQGLYNKLKSMHQSGGTNASNITIPGVKGYVGESHGPCN